MDVVRDRPLGEILIEQRPGALERSAQRLAEEHLEDERELRISL